MTLGNSYRRVEKSLKEDGEILTEEKEKFTGTKGSEDNFHENEVCSRVPV